MSSTLLKLVNVPWNLGKTDLTRYLSRTLNSRVRYSKVLYDKTTGLSRGIALISLENDRLNNDVLKRGTLHIDGRNVGVYLADRNGKQETDNK